MRSNASVVACVPAWNAGEFIAETLDSIAAQTYNNLRVLISVDLSTDDTAEICTAYAKKDERFAVVCQSKRLGWVANSNYLLARADSKYCFFAFHDDALEPTYAEKLVDRLEKNEQSVLAFSDMDLLNEGRLDKHSYDLLDAKSSAVERVILLARRGQSAGTWWVPLRGVFRTQIGQRIGGLRTNLAGEYSADWPWLMHLALYGEFIRVPEILLP
jgi:glycosyltransferase involved in cell wall biosynthesis